MKRDNVTIHFLQCSTMVEHKNIKASQISEVEVITIENYIGEKNNILDRFQNDVNLLLLTSKYLM